MKEVQLKKKLVTKMHSLVLHSNYDFDNIIIKLKCFELRFHYLTILSFPINACIYGHYIIYRHGMMSDREIKIVS